MPQNRVYLSFGRHGRYVSDTPIEREDMFSAYLIGEKLHKILPPCETVYYSPLDRAVTTARFEALGLKCQHLLQVDALEESTSSFDIRRFLNQLLTNTEENVYYYHFVTHLPVVEKLGLPFLSAGDICLLTADDWKEMLAENFSLQVLKKPIASAECWQHLKLTTTQFEKLSENEIYNLIQEYRCL